MKMVQDYLIKRGITDPWKIEPGSHTKFNQAVIIPAYGESEYLPLTLASLDTNIPTILKETLVIVVVNNSSGTAESIRNDNQLTLKALNTADYRFTLGIVDAASTRLELPKRQAGVGLARKIGMDLALSHLLSIDSLIFCTDADTIVNKDYIEKVKKYFDTTGSKAAVVRFQHQKPDDPKQEETIRRYEEYLLSTAEKMQDAGSPYGYVAMGSTMVCTAQAYCAVGGMPRKKVTEDFYFLQELSKYNGVHTIQDILVYPSPRPISRVYLGTGFRMEQAQNGFDIKSLYYSDTAFQLLSKWIALGSNAYQVELSLLIKQMADIHFDLTDFLIKEGLKDIWKNLQNNVPSKLHFSKQFHRWFDGLKTIRLLKHFSETE